MSLGPPPTDRKDYYDSYNRYFRLNSIFIHVHAKQTIYRHIYTTSLIKHKDSEIMTDKLYKSDIIQRFNCFVSEKFVRTKMALEVILTLHI